ncbi:Fur family transcriptional regulator [Pectinatus cerevisiiphilus]|uniref:Fur family ferric uptake transcriptional regulator n=1 Tax=Pectinatus cerevisiiphilus TaxID=86956 RepID=A0A4V6NYY8_9FIRM|nr:Fur family transcriptional regulator [Pectinatus cerevisiiphilus]TCS81852.1 Fur family ferric uptake transcriptional regulator [Pectinatus cerevisiiphilus]
MIKNIFKNISQTFIKNGHRLTNQRRIVIEVILNHKTDHMTVEDIYESTKTISPNISLSTVYRIVDFLKQNNIIHKLQVDDDHYFYELINTEGSAIHPHFICKKCGKTIDILNEDILNHAAACQKNITSTYDFKIVSSTILYYGICSNCLEKLKPNALPKKNKKK